MKTVNNKIKKPFVSIGFDATGKLTFNVDLNKTNKLNVKQLGDLGSVFKNVLTSISNGNSKTVLHVLDVYRRKTGIEFSNNLTVDQLEAVKTYIRNGEKLMAVKTFKDYTGAGLKDSKDFCDFFAKHIEYS